MKDRVQAFPERLVSIRPAAGQADHFRIGAQASDEATEVDRASDEISVNEDDLRTSAFDVNGERFSGSNERDLGRTWL